MRRVFWILLCCSAFAACVSTRPPAAPTPWERRVSELQHLGNWQLDGRAAVALGTQGWQATLNWRQRGDSAQVHVAGPFGVGALVLERTADGLSLNGAPPSEAVMAQLQKRLGFELPIDEMRFWLLGVPDPGAMFELGKNAQGRAQHLTQAGWSVDYDRYMPVAGDVLPARLVLSREGVRVRIAVDRWDEGR